MSGSRCWRRPVTGDVASVSSRVSLCRAVVYPLARHPALPDLAGDQSTFTSNFGFEECFYACVGAGCGAWSGYFGVHGWLDLNIADHDDDWSSVVDLDLDKLKDHETNDINCVENDKTA